MEKKKAHYSLSEIQRVVEARGVHAFTATALTGAAALGLSNAQAVAVVLELKQKNLYKSMTTHHDLAGCLPRNAANRFSGLHQGYFT